MAENTGWVAVHRSLLDWEWYDDTNVKVVFLHLLLTANHKDKKWQGILIKRGQLITSYPHISAQLSNRYHKFSIQQVRTSLDKLKTTGEVTVKTTNKYSLITINNYDKYQSIDSQKDTQITVNQQTSNSQSTTNNNDNNVNNDNNISKDICTSSSSEDNQLTTIVNIYNNLFGKNVSSTSGFEKNYEYWRTVHGLDKIQMALENASRDRFWKDKMTLTILFRRKNPQGEPVDYIEDLANRTPSTGGMVAII